ncbi:uncharacterized protein [Littorina saxatilis]|uniref:uncharacterized protein n=1 Tax=Littorina saxatilis TaxID=31220 RepID=UPI0038B6ADA5
MATTCNSRHTLTVPDIQHKDPKTQNQPLPSPPKPAQPPPSNNNPTLIPTPTRPSQFRAGCLAPRVPRETAEVREYKLWVQNTGRQDLLGKTPGQLYKGTVLCEDHFESCQQKGPLAQERPKADSSSPANYKDPWPRSDPKQTHRVLPTIRTPGPGATQSRLIESCQQKGPLAQERPKADSSSPANYQDPWPKSGLIESCQLSGPLAQERPKADSSSPANYKDPWPRSDPKQTHRVLPTKRTPVPGATQSRLIESCQQKGPLAQERPKADSSSPANYQDPWPRSDPKQTHRVLPTIRTHGPGATQSRLIESCQLSGPTAQERPKADSSSPANYQDPWPRSDPKQTHRVLPTKRTPGPGATQSRLIESGPNGPGADSSSPANYQDPWPRSDPKQTHRVLPTIRTPGPGATQSRLIESCQSIRTPGPRATQSRLIESCQL